MNNDLSQIFNIRTEYLKTELHEDSVKTNALDQFSVWFDEALNAKVMEPNAMTLATSAPDGQTDVRTVLLKQIDATGFVFFTNYHSKKGRDIASNNKVALLFFWPELERQVRVLGIAEKISFKESEDYFQSRPIGSQLGALASHQSARIESRTTVEQKLETLQNKFNNIPIPLPDFWGGYRVVPHQLEFWQGRANRLHDRIVYNKITSSWEIYRVSP